MFTVTVRDHMMIAHSLPDPGFGPARNMHGATYVVDAEFSSENLNKLNIVIDIGEATELLQNVLSTLNYQNLDELSDFDNVLTTTEFLAQFIHRKMSDNLPDNISLKITLHESHIASASYQG
jgi:6-pyruvoyl-tetrahydropterin synthase